MTTRKVRLPVLRRIWSDQFRKRDEQRPPIEFKPGLNTVRGGQGAENSIGKSTLLSIVDFVFGGQEFLESSVIAVGPGHHIIHFDFQFGEETLHFSRDTEDFGYVQTHIDADHRQYGERISLDAFRQLLKEKYQLDSVDAGFHDITKRFFRIHGHGTAFPHQPLRFDTEEPAGAGAAIFEKLFGIYEEIEALEDPYRQADADIKALNRTRKQQLFQTSMLPNDTAYKKAKTSLANKRELLAQLTGESDIQMLHIRAANDSAHEELNQERNELWLKRSGLRASKKAVDAGLHDRITVSPAQLGRLKQLFPALDVRKVEEVDAFHNKMTEILHAEMEEQSRIYKSEIEALDHAIRSIDVELARLHEPLEIPADKLNEIIAVTQEITILEQQVENWKNYKKIKEDKEAAKNSIERDRPAILRTATTPLNKQISVYNDEVVGASVFPPRLEFPPTGNKYWYGSKGDSGTGTVNKNLMLFDLAMLRLTALPAVIHDSTLNKHISNASIQQLFQLCTTFTDRQIFIAFDKDHSYAHETVKIIDATEVVKLGEGEDSLYGWQWNKPKEDKEPERTPEAKNTENPATTEGSGE